MLWENLLFNTLSVLRLREEGVCKMEWAGKASKKRGDWNCLQSVRRMWLGREEALSSGSEQTRRQEWCEQDFLPAAGVMREHGVPDIEGHVVEFRYKKW